MNKPLLVLGMHRSGTTMIAEVLQDLGVFIGDRYGRNKEAYFFMNRNEWILRRAGGAWDNPLPALEIMSCSRTRGKLVDKFRSEISSLSYVQYTGWASALKPSRQHISAAKDPRFIFTLPLWNEVLDFPALITITRNGPDVARSLNVRAIKTLDSKYQNPLGCFNRNRRLTNLFSRYETYLLTSIRCLETRRAYALWIEYNRQLLTVLQTQKSPVLQLKYEDVVAYPLESVARIAEFCGLDLPRCVISGIATKINRPTGDWRSRSPVGDELADLANSCDLMKTLGYLD